MAAASRLRAVAAATATSSWSGQGVAAVAAATVATAQMHATLVVTAVRLLPGPFMSSHLRGRRLLIFLK